MLSLVAGSFNLKHFLVIQHCFFLPGPPNLGLSLQLLQLPQSIARQPWHWLQRLFRANNNYIIVK